LGARGPQGVVGAQGFAGAQGPQGAQGSAGAAGPQGPVGFQGARGFQGVQGAQGVQGDIGRLGAQGPQGVPGSVTGRTGTASAVSGAAGAQGPSGAQGSTGSPGAQGISGSTVTQVNALGVNTATFTQGYIYATGNITAYYSDKRLKNIHGNIENSLSKVKEINGVYYESSPLAYKYGYTDTNKQVGVIAQEVEKVIPEVIRSAPFDSDKYGGSVSGEKYLTVQYEKIIPVLIEALKEQKSQIDYIKSKL
jgi:hypothetical protein